MMSEMSRSARCWWAPLLCVALSLQQGCGGAQKASSEAYWEPAQRPEPWRADPPPSQGEPLEGITVVKGGVDADMFFRHYGVNPTIETAARATSTFSVDVDTASYGLARAFLRRGVLPQEASVRVEEFVNAFTYDDPPPADGAAPFAAHGEIFPSPNRAGYHVMRLAVRGRVIDEEARKPADLVFVIDVSGSMDRGDRLGLVKRSLIYMVDQLNPSDTVAVVTYGDSAQVALPPTSARAREVILAAISGLSPQGSTHAQAGLELGYELAAQRLAEGRTGRVVLCSDGVANTGVIDPDGLYARIRHFAEEGVWLTTVGVGMGNYNDVMMERLAQLGQGRYLYVDGDAEARRAFVHTLTGNLEVIAKDVKVQVEFDPQAVSRYRLLGYENRLLAAEDFADDRVDAGEIGAGHQVTALYELKISGASGDLGALRLRFKSPEGGASTPVEFPLTRALVRPGLEQASEAGRLAWIVAAFAEKLRGAYWARNLRYEGLLADLGRLPPEWRRRSEVAELAQLIERARALDARADRFEQEMPQAHMDFDHVPILSDSSGRAPGGRL